MMFPKNVLKLKSTKWIVEVVLFLQLIESSGSWQKTEPIDADLLCAVDLLFCSDLSKRICFEHGRQHAKSSVPAAA